MKTSTRKLFCLMAALLVFASCTKPDDGPEPEPDPEPEPEPTLYYEINGVKHEIAAVALYEDIGNGYNIVFSDSDAPLCSCYDGTGNHSFNLMSVDIASSTVGQLMTIGKDDLSDLGWSFYMATWDRESYQETFLNKPVSGSYEVTIDEDVLKIELSIEFEGGEVYGISYEGEYTRCYDYVWCEMCGYGSFSVGSDFNDIWLGATLYHDIGARGYELKVTSGDNSFILDFSEDLVGKKSIIGEDSLSLKAEGQTAVWTFLAITNLNGEKKTYTDDGIGKTFKSGYLDIYSVTDDTVDLDLNAQLSDGTVLDLHFHGDYTSVSTLDR